MAHERMLWLLSLFCALCHLSFVPVIDAPAFDEGNPVDIFGHDGLAFTPDDPLIARGGYTNNMIFTTAYGHMVDGLACGSISQAFSLYIGSYNYADSTIMFVPIYDNSGYFPAATGWQIDPQNESNPDEFYYFPSGDPRLPDVPTGESYFDTSAGVKAAFYRFHGWEFDGNLGGNPALRVCVEHFPKFDEYDVVQHFEVGKARLDIGVLSLMNMETGDSGICGRGFCWLEDIYIRIKGDYPAPLSPIVKVKLDGKVTNATPYIKYKVKVLGVTVYRGKYVIDAAKSKEWIDKVRDAMIPPEPRLNPTELAAIDNAWATGTGLDRLGNEIIRTVMRSGKWLKWIGTTDPIFQESPQINVSNTNLDNFSDDYRALGVVGGKPSASNNGMSHLSGDVLLYGRDSPHNFCRLIEWFAANWLCLNLNIFDPYGMLKAGSAPGTVESGGTGLWEYHDLICNKVVTTDDPYQVEGWPPNKYWYGGQGFVCGAQGAVSHQGDASGSDLVCSFPGNPRQVFATLVAVMPEANPSTMAGEAVYDVKSAVLGGQDVFTIDWADDGAIASQRIPWPPQNDQTIAGASTEVKSMYANVANGHDDRITNGDFVMNWDFNADGTADGRFGNAAYDTQGAQNAFMLVVDKTTGRTGYHLIEINH